MACYCLKLTVPCGLLHMKRTVKSMRLAYFPPNTTSHLQPLDQGIINSLKVHYRSRMLVKVVSEMENANGFSSVSSVNLLDAIHLISYAWNILVLKETVVNCFRKAGFQKQSQCEMEPVEDDISALIENLNPTYQSYARLVGLSDTPPLADFVFVDESVEVARQETVAEIVETVTESVCSEHEAGMEASDDDSNETVVHPRISKETMQESVLNLRRYLIQHPNVPIRSFQLVDKVERVLNALNLSDLRQTTMDEYIF